MTGSIGSLMSASVDRYNMKHRYTDNYTICSKRLVGVVCEFCTEENAKKGVTLALIH